ncbi:MAG: transcriptional regulator [Acidobacteria bacterium]|nr:transcriptional regulator [Acidobacteriota bacterium]
MAVRGKERGGSAFIKTEDVEYHLRCASGAKAIYREEVWEDEAGNVVKYNLAFIHFGICPQDHGRAVGYDNAHGRHERHFMGEVREVEFVSYEATLRRFQAEVRRYRETT